MTLFTPEDLLLYLYKETSPAQTAAIEAAFTEDWTLQRKLEEVKASIDRLDSCLESPRSEVIQRILNYAKETETATAP